jgi:hypothetical protein
VAARNPTTHSHLDRTSHTWQDWQARQQSPLMAKLSISIPDELLKEIETRQKLHEKYISLSGFCCKILEKGLSAHEKEIDAIKAAATGN